MKALIAELKARPTSTRPIISPIEWPTGRILDRDIAIRGASPRVTGLVKQRFFAHVSGQPFGRVQLPTSRWCYPWRGCFRADRGHLQPSGRFRVVLVRTVSSASLSSVPPTVKAVAATQSRGFWHACAFRTSSGASRQMCGQGHCCPGSLEKG